MWRLAGPEPTLDANNHQIAHHFAGDAGGRGRPGDDFPIASVDGKQDPEELAIAASELEMIGAPTDIRAQGDHDTVVGASWPAASVPLQGQFIDLHVRSTRLALIAGLPSAFCCRFTKRVMRRYP